MVKKIFLLLAVALTLPVMAQTTGQWKLHPIFVGTNVQAIYDTPSLVYYLASSNLYRFDKATEENESLSKSNILNDVMVDGIFYNYDQKYLVLAYRNSNIDLLMEDGSVINIPDIKDAVLTSSKTINDVTFYDGLIYVATNFGYVVINEGQWNVKESHVFNTALSSVARVGNTLLLCSGTTTYYGSADKYHNTLGAYKTVTFSGDMGRYFPISDTKFFLRTSTTFSLGTVNGSGDAASVSAKAIVSAKSDNVQRTPTGFLANFMAKGFYYTTNAEGGAATKVTATKEMFSQHPSDGTMWAVGASGLHQKDVESYYKPSAINVADPFWVEYNNTLGKVYVHSSAPNFIENNHENHTNTINCYDGNTWTDVTFVDNLTTGGGTWLNFDPNDPNTYYQAWRRQGLYKVKNNELQFLYKYGNNTSPFGAAHTVVPRFDRHGNLWVTANRKNDNESIWILPAAKVASATSPLKADWITQKLPGVNTGELQFSRVVALKNADIMVHTPGDWGRPIYVIDESNINAANPTYLSVTSINDQDGSSLDWNYIFTLAVDNNDNVWVGYNNGLFYFNPQQALADRRIVGVRPKIARNDGTNLADYLCDGIQVNCIYVDARNHKWIATHYSGIFEVNEDNSKILNHFTTSNSSLPSNTVYNLVYNESTNSMIAVTGNGVAEYFPTVASSATDLSNVYAYPNPVRPDFTGLVTIAGLMDGTLVKIADSGGNVIKTLRSSGSTVTWDACDNNGERVPTGVYVVLASEGNSNGTEKAVTKLMIVK